MACKWLKKRSFHLFRHPKWSRIILERHIFDPFLTHSWLQNNPSSRHFMTPEGPKWLANGSKKAHFTCLGTPNGLGSFFEKHIFDPFFTHFLSQNNPFSRHLAGLVGPKRAATSSKRAKTTCSGIPCGPGSFLKKVNFFAPGGRC